MNKNTDAKLNLKFLIKGIKPNKKSLCDKCHFQQERIGLILSHQIK